ncbi:von Willebrand factor A [Achromatium sp. WMS2]|nr:von Willebrand factor A [Achromatium sp. WMS2]
MSESGLHFAQPWWLLGLLVIIPVIWWLKRSVQRAGHSPLYLYADRHLLPHLTGTRELNSKERWRQFARWTSLWTLAIAAMAGPRWDYTEVHLFHPGNNLLILLDISRSMLVTDVSPNRLGRAKQEVQDIITLNQVARIGLIAFASVPHVITPLTEDMTTLRNVLPNIDTDLIELQGSRLLAALERAEILLQGLAPNSARTILVISDGDFDEPGVADKIRSLERQQVRLLALGIGTSAGGPVPAKDGGKVLDQRGQPVLSTLNAAELTRLAAAGSGFYLEANYRQQDSEAILQAAARSQIPQTGPNEVTRIWNERYFILLLLLLTIMLPMWRLA